MTYRRGDNIKATQTYWNFVSLLNTATNLGHIRLRVDQQNTYVSSVLCCRVVMIPIPVSENASAITKNAGICIGEYASLCTNQIPSNLVIVTKQYPALTDVTYLKSVFFAALKQYPGSCTVLPLATTSFKSDEEERREPTKLAKCLHLAIYNSHRRCVRNCFLCPCIGSGLSICQLANLGIRIGVRKDKIALEHL